MRSLIAALAFGLACVAATPSVAQSTPPDYVFNVPVRIENAPALNGREFSVACTVWQDIAGPDRAYSSSAGLPRIPTYAIGPTGYRDTVRVEVRLPPGVPRSEIRRWTCDLSFYTVTSASGVAASWRGDVEGYRAQTGQAATTTRSVGGNF